MSTEYLLNLSVSAQIALSSAGCMLIAVIFDIFLAYRKLEKMEHLLNQCRLVNDYKCLLGEQPSREISQAMRSLCGDRPAKVECKTSRH